MKEIEKNKKIIKLGKKVLKEESNSIKKLIKNINKKFISACKLIINCKGKIITTGIGKSGIVAKKISSTLSSTGTSSQFLHPTDALHGDLGIISKKDIIITLSKSGETKEIINLIKIISKNKNKIISITGNLNSNLYKMSNITISSYVKNEACFLNLIPTSSSITAMAIGDALSICVSKLKNFTKENFLETHPGGEIGKYKKKKIIDIMLKNNKIIKENNETFIYKLISKMIKNNKNISLIIKKKHIKGIISLENLLKLIKNKKDIYNTKIKEITKLNFITKNEDVKIENLTKIMIKKKVNFVIIKNKNNKIKGIIKKDFLKNI